MPNKEVVKSPATGTENVSLLETIPSKKIIEQYSKIEEIDVSRFFTNIEEVYIYRCNDTGFRFYYPSTIFADEKFYAFLQQRNYYYSEWHWEHEVAAKNLPAKGKILEVGCGTGSFLIGLRERGYDCTGLELNEAAVKVCVQKGLTVYKELLETHLLQHSSQYDAICSFQVLEHVYDVKSFLNGSLSCLKPGGKLVIGVPNNNPYLYKYDKFHPMNLPPHHSGLWNKAAFKKLPDFYPMKLDTIDYEPLFNRQYFLNVYFEHFKMGALNKIINKLHPGFINKVLLPLKFFVKGRNIMAVYTKTA
jgi:SAM-dependent methyltransferase